jgi:hypothetical protein
VVSENAFEGIKTLERLRTVWFMGGLRFGA